jgi:uncharacterized protein YlxW (UPF0749 family)
MSPDQRAEQDAAGGAAPDDGRRPGSTPTARSAPDDVPRVVDPTPAPDAGTTDVGTTDAGTTDAGTTDAGTTDAGTADAGTADAGTGTGEADTAPPDAAAAADGETATEPGTDEGHPPDDGGAAARAPLRRRGRDPLAAVLIGVLTLLLGFAFAVQVRSTDTDQVLAGAREEDLVRILDDLTAQQDRLRQEIADQRAALDQLGGSDSAAAAALKEAQDRSQALGILNGTVAAQGPGLTMTLRDPEGRITSAVVLNAIQELRGAGAETMQVDDVRIGVSSAVTGAPGHLQIDGQDLQAPYTFVVIGSAQDMATAMSIPGGVVSKVGGRGGSVDIVQSEQVVVDALRPLDEPQYAEPDTGD